jgi:hypothetical protein
LKLHQQQLLFIKIHVFFYLLLFWASTYTVTYPEDTRKQQDYAGFAFQLIMINMQRKLHDFMVFFIYLSFITVRGPQFSFHFYWIPHTITKSLTRPSSGCMQNLYSFASVSAISFQYSNLISFIFINFIFFSNIPYSKNSFLFFYLRKQKDNHLTYQL